MRALLVYPRFPTTFWGFQYGLPLAGKRASLPPLGLLTLAALLPRSWEMRLVDLNVEPLRDEDIAWADAVLTGGMLIQADSMRDVVARARAAGRFTVVGGPAISTSPGLLAGADVIFQGEAEGRVEELVAAVEGRRRAFLADGVTARPSLAATPPPRWDLCDVRHYSSMALQYSRGCPFRCEFCDIIEIYGRVPRTKSAAQVVAELDALWARGWRGSVFFVDDNFIGNKRAVAAVLPEIARWQREHGRPYELYTEASVNLAADGALVEKMVAAGFGAVFLGIETPSEDALAAAGKKQNVGVDLRAAVDGLARAGLEVMGGFIVGFDGDDDRAFEAQRAFLDRAPVPLAMVGLLIALPGTQLWRRLAREGRLRGGGNGDQFGRPNFEPRMDEERLVEGYARLLGALYTADAWYDRCEAHLERARPIPGRRRVSRDDLVTFARTTWRVGVLGPRRRRYWRLLRKALGRGPGFLAWAVAHAIQGEHAVRYVAEDVRPRLAAALADIRAEKTRARDAAPESAAVPADRARRGRALPVVAAGAAG